MNRVSDILVAYWRAGLEILLLAAIIYYFLLLFRGTRGAAVFTGLVLCLIGVGAMTWFFQLDVINWIMGRMLAFLAIAVLVIFQPELRRALAQIGSQPLFTNAGERGALIDVLAETARTLSQKRFGALIAIERDIGFRGMQETGIALDAQASTELLTTIFHANTPLHDGGVVLRGDRVVAAGCIFPISPQTGLSTQFGMRHRAAIGLTEETDAVVIIVSEETGMISVAQRGQLLQDFDLESLRRFLGATLAPPARQGNWVTDHCRRFISSLFTTRPAPGNGDPRPPGAAA